MRIIAKNHDYYDPIMKSGFDLSLIYMRTVSHAVLEGHDQHSMIPIIGKLSMWSWRNRAQILETNTFYIGFCNKLYPCIKLTASSFAPLPGTNMCYSIEDVDIFIKAHFSQKSLDVYNKKEKNLERTDKWDREHLRDEFEKFFIGASQVKRSAFGIPETLPIFVARNRRNGFDIDVNVPLKDYKFYRIFDAPRTYQELSMFLGAQAVPSKAIPVLSDIDKIQILGHNKTTSFRNMPRK